MAWKRVAFRPDLSRVLFLFGLWSQMVFICLNGCGNPQRQWQQRPEGRSTGPSVVCRAWASLSGPSQTCACPRPASERLEPLGRAGEGLGAWGRPALPRTLSPWGPFTFGPSVFSFIKWTTITRRFWRTLNSKILLPMNEWVFTTWNLKMMEMIILWSHICYRKYQSFQCW